MKMINYTEDEDSEGAIIQWGRAENISANLLGWLMDNVVIWLSLDKQRLRAANYWLYHHEFLSEEDEVNNLYSTLRATLDSEDEWVWESLYSWLSFEPIIIDSRFPFSDDELERR
jgi:hypothetical protein